MSLDLGPVVFTILLWALLVWSTFWVIRLAVRYGVCDALRIHRDLLTPGGQPAGAKDGDQPVAP